MRQGRLRITFWALTYPGLPGEQGLPRKAYKLSLQNVFLNDLIVLKKGTFFKAH